MWHHRNIALVYGGGLERTGHPVRLPYTSLESIAFDLNHATLMGWHCRPSSRLIRCLFQSWAGNKTRCQGKYGGNCTALGSDGAVSLNYQSWAHFSAAPGELAVLARNRRTLESGRSLALTGEITANSYVISLSGVGAQIVASI